MNYLKTFFSLVATVIFCTGFFAMPTLQAQKVLDTIPLKNKSFEAPPGAFALMGWTDCSFPGETPFDIQPGKFDCNTAPASGNTYMGMVVRDNETYEAASQRLVKPLLAGKCYGFTLKLARSTSYYSISHKTQQPSYYVTPARVRVWGGNQPCERREMLAETGVVTNTKWKTFYFKMEPRRNYRYIVIETFFKTPTLFPYNGNVLIDDASDILEIDCNEDVAIVFEEAKVPSTPVAEVKKPTPKPTKITKPTRKHTAPPRQTPPPPAPSEKKIMTALNKKVHKGQRLRIPNLTFKANSAVLPKEADSVIQEIYEYLIEYPEVKIEIGGYTNNRCEDDFCNKLSKKRAKAVADALIAKGIAADRISYKGYGKKNPVATNATLEGRKKNQRVEIKIL